MLMVVDTSHISQEEKIIKYSISGKRSDTPFPLRSQLHEQSEHYSVLESCY